ncbi:ankyrin repeat-containing protein ITN1-like [Pistacia vera]|uniref:ankyrin repeat-containing protein ITN1-like n=1 Tax=Pistacia vera TaxID=55513 RepID=UPI0012630780|nr:ankyrin repeat-containing protein ITN1-like [Pistacia vera]
MGDHQIVIDRLTPNATSTESTHERRKPSCHLLSRENSNLYLNNCVPLYKAALKGDWTNAKKLLEKDPTMLSASITKGQETVLHIAAGAKQTRFVEELIKSMQPEDLTLSDQNGSTAFCCAAAAGATEIARIMLKKNPSLLAIRGSENMMPVFLAALLAQGEMSSFLYDELSQAQHVFNWDDKVALFFTCLTNGLYDLALKMLKDGPDLALARDRNCETALHDLARKPSIFPNKNQGPFKRLINSFLRLMKLNHNKDFQSTQALELVKCLWEETLKQDDLELANLTQTPSRIVFEAAKFGNSQFLAELIHRYPDVIYHFDENDYSIFHIAVLHRHADVFNLIYEIGLSKDLFITCEDKDQHNNMLHLAAKLPHPSRICVVSGAALQMQRELVWFKGIEKIVKPSFRGKKNSNGQTPKELFTEEHKELLKRGEQWMKDTAKSCMLVATIITTVIFEAVFSVPGGNDSSKGLPIHLKETWFQVFVISDAIALSFSSISILIFLSILTSRYTEDDFLESLPFKLMVGFSTLFVSIITMMVAFSATLLLAYHDSINCVTMLTSVVAFVPTTLYVLLQYPIFGDIFCSTYHSRFLFKPSDPMF